MGSNHPDAPQTFPLNTFLWTIPKTPPTFSPTNMHPFQLSITHHGLLVTNFIAAYDKITDVTKIRLFGGLPTFQGF